MSSDLALKSKLELVGLPL
ncbi:uncharacterized protein FFE2_10669 [Fusarium fujikuroi]|nr:uncharacterized protein FFE2_10669 [Fusarium fujikuroi]